MGRKCSHCGNTGHNARTCTSPRNSNNNNLSGSLKLFGVLLPLSSSFLKLPIKKSFSTDCFPLSSSFSSSRVTIHQNSSNKLSNGSLSDGFIAPAQERKKGVPWTVEEHRVFLMGLEKIGKGDWRGISKNFVKSRTPRQVASHAQKYFLRQKTRGFRKRKRRQSLFDVGSNKFSDKVLNPCTGSCSCCKPDEVAPNFCGLLLKANPSNSRNKNICEFEVSPSHQNSAPKCLSESSLNFKPATNSCDRTMIRAATATPNLELTLAAPTPLDQIQRKDCTRDLLIEAISVT